MALVIWQSLTVGRLAHARARKVPVLLGNCARIPVLRTFKKNEMQLPIKNDHADGFRSGFGAHAPARNGAGPRHRLALARRSVASAREAEHGSGQRAV
jgi:hypothetical protein